MTIDQPKQPGARKHQAQAADDREYRFGWVLLVLSLTLVSALTLWIARLRYYHGGTQQFVTPAPRAAPGDFRAAAPTPSWPNPDATNQTTAIQPLAQALDLYVQELSALRDRFGLTLKQVAAVGAALADFREERWAYERRIARWHSLTPHQVVIDIPAYPAEGAAMLASFRAEMTKAIGPETAAKVEQGVFYNLASDMGYFGEYPQQFTVTARPDGFVNIERRVSSPSPGNFFSHGTDVIRHDNLGPYQYLADLFPQ